MLHSTAPKQDLFKALRYKYCFSFAVLDGENQMNDYENGIKKFTEEQDKFNASGSSPVPLMIAFGMAEYNLSDGDPEKAEQIADSRMYEKKKQMKAEN